jgi:hypothetical protein
VLLLPDSGLEVLYSARYYKLKDKDTPSLKPDKLIGPVRELYTAGPDPGAGMDSGATFAKVIAA